MFPIDVEVYSLNSSVYRDTWIYISLWARIVLSTFLGCNTASNFTKLICVFDMHMHYDMFSIKKGTRTIYYPFTGSHKESNCVYCLTSATVLFPT